LTDFGKNAGTFLGINEAQTLKLKSLLIKGIVKLYVAKKF
jgi:hypothetical protein